jgi:hydrogenase maturation protease
MTDDRPSTVVIGVGNLDRGDDGLGPAAARLLRERVEAARWRPGFAAPEIIEHGRDVASLILARARAQRLILIDACVSGSPPGTIHRFDVSAAGMPPRLLPGSCHSSHGFGLAAALELARALGRLPPRSVVYAVEACSFAAGTPLSPALVGAAAEVARRVFAELAGDRPQPTPREQRAAQPLGGSSAT